LTPVPPTATRTYTLRPTNTRAPTATRRPSITPTRTRTLTPTISPTFTQTPAATGTETHTPTTTPTETATPILTPTRTQIPLPPRINIGPPDKKYYPIVCGKSVIVDLGQITNILTLIFYEVEQPSECKGGICLNWVIIELSKSTTSGWTRYFYWGDYDPNNNGNVRPYHFKPTEKPPETDGEPIPNSELYKDQGVRITIGGIDYQYIRFTAPDKCSHPAQVDAVDYEPRP
jgi:hypothetical protein